MSLSDPVKIGLLYSTTGPTAAMETSQWRGSILAIEEINQAGGLDGRELVPVHLDPQSDTALFRTLAERLIVRDGVNAIFGGYTSSSRKAMLPVVERYGRLLFYPEQYEGFEYSENIIYSGASPNQNGVPLAEFMTTQFGPRVYMVGSRYVYPFECNRTMRELVLQHASGAVLGERYLDLDADYAQFGAVVRDVVRKRPDFIFCTVIGRTVPYLYEAFAQAGLDAATMPIGSLNTSETETGMMTAGVAQGHYTSAAYFQSVDTPENHAALQRFRQRFGGVVAADMNWEAAYHQMHLYACAFRKAGSDAIGSIMPHLRGAEYAAPQGRVRIDPDNHHTALFSRIGVANAAGQFTILRESAHALAPDPYLASYSPGDWVAHHGSVEH
jgi:branched-chain amino acid transport system substrate-binding protein